MRALPVAAAAVALALVAGFLWLRTSLPETDGRMHVAGLDRPVDILRDGYGVPHIFARSEDDAWFGVGFAHAQDRLWQMEVMRRAGQGRLSELLGKRAVGSDAMMRTLGLYRLAEADFAHLAPPVRRALVAYAAGVNAYIAAHAGALPPEFVLLGDRPAPWRPADSLVWGRIMALRLSTNWRTEALRAALSTRLTPRQMDDLWPAGGQRRAESGPPSEAARLARMLLDRFPDTLAPIEASNVWAVGGARTQSGKPLLANDPHLGFSAPILWYLVQVSAPGLDVTGATAPGVPFVLLGHNARIAWGLASAETDTEDLFVEKLDPADPDRYLTPEGPRLFETRRETIAVRDAKPLTIAVRATRHGSVVSGLAPGLGAAAGKGEVIALAATALRPVLGTAEAIWRLDHAGNVAGFRDALRRLDAPAQNVAYADVDGHIGVVTAGLAPIRKAVDGLAPVPGWSGAYDWTGFVPFDALPQRFDPPTHRVVNANGRPAPPDYPYFLGRYWTPPFRADRIRRLIDARPRHTASSMEEIQGDVVSEMARDLKPLMLAGAAPVDPRAREAVALLRGWDGTMDADRPEPLIFTAWLAALVRRIAADEMGPDFAAWRGLHPRFVRRVLTGDSAWCDDVTTRPVETCHGQLAAALDDALAALRKRTGDDIAKWRWGDLHFALFRHLPFGYVPVLRNLFDVTVADGGGAYTIDRAAMTLAEPTPFAAVHGPGLRAIYDLADLDRSRFMIATGQSGNPFSIHYDDLTEAWRDVRSFTIESDREWLDSTAVGRLRLVPRPTGE